MMLWLLMRISSKCISRELNSRVPLISFSSIIAFNSYFFRFVRISRPARLLVTNEVSAQMRLAKTEVLCCGVAYSSVERKLIRVMR